MKYLKVLALAAAMMGLSHCGSTSATNGIATSYYTSNGYCYATGGAIVSSTYCSGLTSSTGYTMSGTNCVNSSGAIVSISYCSGTSSNGYTLSNGYCLNSAGQPVALSYCSTAGGGAVTCVGTYYQQSYSGMQMITCNGANCSGKTLFNAFGAPVICL